MTARGRSEQSSPLAARISAAHAQLMSSVAPLQLDRTSRSEDADEWSVGEVLAHVPEFMRYWWTQVEVLRDRPGVEFGRTKQDPDRIAWVADRGGLPLRDLVEDLDRITQETVRLVAALTDADLEKSGVHFHRGQMTVRDVVETFLVEHLGQLRAAVSAAEGRGTSTEDRTQGVSNHG